MGLAMGLTAIAIIYSPWGKRSGAHINPAVTLAFLRLGKVKPGDALFYALAQFAGGGAGVLLVWLVLGDAFARPPVSFVATVPGTAGLVAAFATEFAMAFGLMTMIVTVLGSPRWEKWIGLLAGAFVATYITLLAPLSGMSINPARTFGSALPDGGFGDIWLYFTAPVLGMLAAVELYRAVVGRPRFASPKLCPNDETRCIFTGFDPTAPQGGPHPTVV